MRWKHFLLFNVVGATLWVTAWTTLGYLSGSHIDAIYADATRYSTYVAIALAVLGSATWHASRGADGDRGSAATRASACLPRPVATSMPSEGTVARPSMPVRQRRANQGSDQWSPRARRARPNATVMPPLEPQQLTTENKMSRRISRRPRRTTSKTNGSTTNGTRATNRCSSSIPVTPSSCGRVTSATTRSPRTQTQARSTHFDWDRAYPLTGPIGVHGAEPGDTLKIEILDVHTQGWGWTGVIPGNGLLPEDFPGRLSADLRPLTRGRRLHARGHRDPARALLRDDGCLPGRRDRPAGAAARHASAGTSISASSCRGSTLYLPVQVEQALFSCGDAHGAQGDGEVCVTGIEAPMFGALRFTLEKGRSIPGPQYRTPAPLTPRVDSAPFYGTTGVGGDLYAASQDAVRAMIDHLGETYDLAARTRICFAASLSTSRSQRSSTAASTSSAPCSPSRSSSR